MRYKKWMIVTKKQLTKSPQSEKFPSKNYLMNQNRGSKWIKICLSSVDMLRSWTSTVVKVNLRRFKKEQTQIEWYQIYWRINCLKEVHFISSPSVARNWWNMCKIESSIWESKLLLKPLLETHGSRQIDGSTWSDNQYYERFAKANIRAWNKITVI